MNKRRSGGFGFTLAELLIVIVVIGILASIGIPRFAAQKDKAYVAEAVNIMGAIRQGQLAYRLEHPTYKDLSSDAGDWDVIGISNPNDNPNAKFEYTVTDADADSAIVEAEQIIAGRAQGEAIELDVASGQWGGDHRFRPRN